MRCVKQTEVLTIVPHVNGWFPAVYMSSMNQNFLFASHIEFIRSKLSISSAHVSGPILTAASLLVTAAVAAGVPCVSTAEFPSRVRLDEIGTMG